VYKKRDY
jgi:hypothetical protein